MKAIKFLFLLISITSVFSCEKKYEPIKKLKPLKVFPVSSEIKEWGLFKPGSYWVMRDSASGTLDSIYVIEIKTGAGIRSSYTDDSDKVVENIDVIYLSGGVSRKYSMISWPYDQINQSDLFGHTILAIDTSKHCDVQTCGLYKNSAILSYTVLNNIFSNVRFIHESYLFYSSHAPSGYVHYIGKYYWKKNFGLIKKVDMNDFVKVKTSELVRYQVFQ